MVNEILLDRAVCAGSAKLLLTTLFMTAATTRSKNEAGDFFWNFDDGPLHLLPNSRPAVPRKDLRNTVDNTNRRGAPDVCPSHVHCISWLVSDVWSGFGALTIANRFHGHCRSSSRYFLLLRDLVPLALRKAPTHILSCLSDPFSVPLFPIPALASNTSLFVDNLFSPRPGVDRCGRMSGLSIRILFKQLR